MSETVTSRLSKFLLPLVVLVVGITVSGAILTGKPAPEPVELPAPEPAKAVVREAIPGAHRVTIVASGTVRARREIEITAEVTGRVVSVSDNYARGATVSAGELLLQLDPADYQAALARAKASLADAHQALAVEKGQVKQARRQWRDLGSAESNTLFLREPQLARAEAMLSAAEAELAQAQRNLERTRISAAFDGRITEIHADLGQYVRSGTPIAEIYQRGALEVDIPLSSAQRVLLDPDTAPATIRTPDQHAAMFQGRLARSNGRIDPATRMLTGIIEIDAEQGADLLPGTFVSAEIQGRSFDNSLELPRSALRPGSMLWILGDGDVLRRLPVELIYSNGEQVLVTGALPETLRVILSPLPMAVENTVLKPVPESRL